jgi:hypothetical protein
MQVSCCVEQDLDTLERLRALEPSASTLVLLVYLFSKMFENIPQR